MLTDPRDVLAQRAAEAPAPGIASGSSGYFTAPTQSLDPNLFEGETLLPGVRDWILRVGYGFLNSRFKGAHTWATIWIAGSGITYQWSAARSPGDLDILVGVKPRLFKQHNPGYSGHGEVDIAHAVTDAFRELDLWTDRTHFVVNSVPWVEDPCNGTQPPLPSNTLQVGLSRVSPKSSSAPPTPSSTTSSVPGSSYARAVADRRARFAGAVNPTQFSSVGSVPPVAPSISESGISSGSTESLSQSTYDSWLARRDVALSAREQQSRSGMGFSKSITTTPPGGFEDSFASPAIIPSEPSGIALRESSGSSLTSVGDAVYSVTWYVNPGAEDIRDIRPYAAYDVTHGRWTVPPPQLPGDWSDRYFPAHWWAEIGAERKRANELINDFLSQRAAYLGARNDGQRTNAAASLNYSAVLARVFFDDIHDQRRTAFGPNGNGYSDWYNFRWQAHKRNGVIPALHALATLQKESVEQSQQEIYGHPLVSTEQALSTASLLHAHLNSLSVR